MSRICRNLIILFAGAAATLPPASADGWLTRYLSPAGQICPKDFNVQKSPRFVQKLSHTPGTDYFLKARPLEPKLEIVNYLEHEGIPTARRFTSLQDALDSKKPFIVRSEFWREYFEAAGLFESYVFDPAKSLSPPLTAALEAYRSAGEPAFWDKLKSIGNLPERIKYYAELTGMPAESIRKEARFSYWEMAPGHNRSVIADSAVPGRYHLFTDGEYAMVENGQLVNLYNDSHPAVADLSWYEDLPGILSMYERIRHLGLFDPKHCPVIELQSDGHHHVALQYHRSRDLQQAGFRLDRPLEEGEVQATFVRGVTPPEGIVIDVEYRMLGMEKQMIDAERKAAAGNGAPVEEYVEKPGETQGAFFLTTIHPDLENVFMEMATRTMKVWFQKPRPDFNGIRLRGHIGVSTAFNMPLYVMARPEWIFGKVHPGLYFEDNRVWMKRQVRVISDGYRAYLKPLGEAPVGDEL
jgi:hypothetical protein